MLSKGEDGKLYVLVDGREELVFRNIENIDIDWGFGTENHNFVGEDRTRVTEVNNPITVTVRIKPDSPGLDRLIELRLARAGQLANRQEVRFDLTCSVNFGNAGRSRWAFPDLKVGNTTSNIPGKGQFVTGSMQFICDSEPKRV